MYHCYSRLGLGKIWRTVHITVGTVQWLTLRCCGFLPLTFDDLSDKYYAKRPALRKLLNVISRIVGLFWLVCQVFAVYTVAQLFLTGSGTTVKTNNWILKALEVMPFTFIGIRPLVILVIMYTQHEASQRLQLKASLFFAVCFPNIQQQREMVTKCKKFAWAAIILTFLLQISFDFYFDYLYAATMNFDWSTDIGLTYPRTNMKWYTITWTLGETLPFFLSQQVYLWAILSAALLATAIKNFHRQLKDELQLLSKCTFTYTSMHTLNEKVIAWQMLYMEMVKFCHSLEHFFSWILFVIYCCDAAALLGFTASIVNHFQEDGWIEASLPVYAFSAFVYAVYGTLFAIPFVVVSERSAALLFTVHELSLVTKYFETEKRMPDLDSADLANNLEQLKGNLRDNQCHFSGGGLFHYTRGFLVGTFTLAISISVLVKELIAKEMEHYAPATHLDKIQAAEPMVSENFTAERFPNLTLRAVLSEL